MRQRSATSSPPEPPELAWLLGAVLLTAGFVAYANAFAGPFVFDDVTGIATNPSLQSLWPPRWLAAAPGSPTAGRLVLNFTFAVNYALGGLDVRGYHAVNVAIHLLAGAALFGVVRRTLLSERMRERYGRAATTIAFAVALVWIVHPLNTEAVTYIVQRGESLAMLWLLVTLYCAIRGWLVMAALACALGMGTKETAIVTPAIVVIWDYVFRPGRCEAASVLSGADGDARDRALCRRSATHRAAGRCGCCWWRARASGRRGRTSGRKPASSRITSRWRSVPRRWCSTITAGRAPRRRSTYCRRRRW